VAVTAALLLPVGDSVQLISLNQPDFQVMLLPLTTAGFSPSFILTDVPSALMKKETSTTPWNGCGSRPDQLPENLAGPEMAGGLCCSLIVVVVCDVGFVERFSLGADVCCWGCCAGAGVGLSGVSTIGAGDLSAARQSATARIK